MKLHIKCYCDIDIPKNDYRLFYATRVNFAGGVYSDLRRINEVLESDPI